MRWLLIPVMLVLLTGCFETIKISRLKEGGGGKELIVYRDVYLKVYGDSMVPAAGTIITDILASDKIYRVHTLGEDVNKSRILLLNVHVTPGSTESPVQRIPLGSNAAVYTRSGKAGLTMQFELSDYKSGKRLYQTKFADVRDKTNTGTAPEVDAINYQVLWNQLASKGANQFRTECMPHYEDIRYQRLKCKHIPKVTLALNYYDSKTYDDAAATLKEAIAEAEKNEVKPIEIGRANFYLGLTLEHLGKFEEALQCYDKALATDFENPDYAHARAECKKLVDFSNGK